jgi:hypothetical protein
MTGITRKPRAKLKTYDVGYYLEQGFTISVKACSADNAERIVRKRLDDANDKLPGSERVHYDDGITGADEVRL